MGGEGGRGLVGRGKEGGRWFSTPPPPPLIKPLLECKMHGMQANI